MVAVRACRSAGAPRSCGGASAATAAQSCARTFTETDPELPPRQRVTERFRRRLLGVSTLSISVFESEAGRPYAGLLQTMINTGVLGPYEQPRPVAELYLLYDFPAVAALVIHRRQYLVSPSSPADAASLALQTALEKTSQTAARLIINDAVWGELWVATTTGQLPLDGSELPPISWATEHFRSR